MPGGSLTSELTWPNTFGCWATSAFFVAAGKAPANTWSKIRWTIHPRRRKFNHAGFVETEPRIGGNRRGGWFPSLAKSHSPGD